MTLSHGMNIEDIEVFGKRLQTHTASELQRMADEIEAIVGRTSGSWVGPDAEAFRSWWPAKRSTLRAVADDVHGFGQAALNNASEQRLASGEAVPAASALGRTATGPPPFVLSEETSDRETKSGAVVRGVDGSNLAYRVMSNGTIQVSVNVSSGMEADFGDAAELVDIARGKFFKEDGVEWDLDVGYSRDGERTFTFTDAESARAFYEGLKDKQDGFMSVTGGMSMHQVHEVIGDLGEDLKGEVEWSGHRGGHTFEASGSFGVRVGDGDAGVGAGLTLERAHGSTVETLASDGSRGELTRMAGSAGGYGNVDFGEFSIDANTAGEYGREVHLIRNDAGVPVRLEVTDIITADTSVSGGTSFLGTGSEVTAGTITRVTSSTVFDLTDPAVANAFDGQTNPSDLHDWSRENSQLGGQTVATYEGGHASSSTSLLFSGEWNSGGENTEISGVQYRAPGGEFTEVGGAVKPEGFENRQIVRHGDGSSEIVYTTSF